MLRNEKMNTIEYEDRTVILFFSSFGYIVPMRAIIEFLPEKYTRTHAIEYLTFANKEEWKKRRRRREEEQKRRKKKDIKITYLPFFIESLHFIYVSWMRKRFRSTLNVKIDKNKIEKWEEKKRSKKYLFAEVRKWWTKYKEKKKKGEDCASTVAVTVGRLTFLLIYRFHSLLHSTLCFFIFFPSSIHIVILNALLIFMNQEKRELLSKWSNWFSVFFVFVVFFHFVRCSFNNRIVNVNKHRNVSTDHYKDKYFLIRRCAWCVQGETIVFPFILFDISGMCWERKRKVAERQSNMRVHVLCIYTYFIDTVLFEALTLRFRTQLISLLHK